MSKLFRRRQGALSALAVAAFAASASAATLYWEPAGDGAPNGGTGNWDTTSALWATSTTEPYGYTTWTNGQSAHLGTTSNAAITLTEPITVGQIFYEGTSTSITINASGNGSLSFDGANAGLLTYERSLIINAPIVSSIAPLVRDTAKGIHVVRQLILGGDNSFSGQIQMNAGHLTITHSNALGVGNNSKDDGTIISTGAVGGTLTLDGTNGALNINEYIQMGAGGRIISTGADNVANGTFEGATYNINHIEVQNHTLTWNGALTSGSIITKQGAGTLVLTSAASTVSQLQVDAGKLVVHGRVTTAYQQKSMVEAGGILAGHGEISTNNERSDGYFQMNGTLAPGDEGVAGTLTFGGSDLRLSETSVLLWDLSSSSASADNDLVELVGTFVNGGGGLTLDGVLRINALDGVLEDGGVYRLFNYRTGGASTDFVDNGLVVDLDNSPASYAYTIDTSTPGQVNLLVTAVPEPASLSLLALGALGLMRRRR